MTASIYIENYCPFCYKRNITRVSPKDYHAWNTLKFPIHVAMPELSAIKRETILSGTCSRCQDHIFKEEEEDEEADSRGDVRPLSP